MSQLQVAQSMGIKRETLSLWENGKSKPGAPQQRKLARIYQVPVAYLRGEIELEEEKERDVLYRGIPKESQARETIDKWLNFLDDWAEFLESTGFEVKGFHTPRRLDHGFETDLRIASALATEVREYYHLGSSAIPDLASFLDKRGILVYRAPLGKYSAIAANHISGAFYNHPKLGSCILVNSDTTPGRQTFTLAHEFAHALYHYSAKGITSLSDQAFEAKERFANAFAAHFLVPSKSMRQVIREIQVIEQMDPNKVVQLASYFRVSYATMLMRLMEEKVISAEEGKQWKQYSPRSIARKLGLDTEPFDKANSSLKHPIDRYPLSVLETIYAAVDTWRITEIDAAELLDVTREDLVKRLSGLPAEATSEEIMEFEELPW
jgi:Zn-dependent peptidase ImmA (M78 family)/DNA-binding XRE family transcriptional regulator